MRLLTKWTAKRAAASLCLALLGSGCALPPAVTVASFAADGVSYMVSGRTVSDHALSYAAQEDCAMHRVVKGEGICKPEAPAGGMALADAGMSYQGTLESLEPATPEPAAPEPAALEPEAPIALLAAPAEEARVEEAALPGETNAEKPGPDVRWAYRGNAGEAATFLALGSYRFRTNAADMAARYATYSPSIVTAYLHGERYYRVVIGPYSEDGVEDAKAALLRAGANPWRVRLCGVEGVGTNCKEAG